MRDLLKDVRLGGRLLARAPGYVTVVAVTLGLATGANTHIFSFADLFLLRPMPVGDPNRTGLRGSSSPRTLRWREGFPTLPHQSA